MMAAIMTGANTSCPRNRATSCSQDRSCSIFNAAETVTKPGYICRARRFYFSFYEETRKAIASIIGAFETLRVQNNDNEIVFNAKRAARIFADLTRCSLEHVSVNVM